MHEHLIEHSGAQNHAIEAAVVRYASTKTQLREPSELGPVSQNMQRNLFDGLLEPRGEVHVLLGEPLPFPSWKKVLGKTAWTEHVGPDDAGGGDLILTLVVQ